MSEQKGGMPARLALEVAHQMGKLLQGESPVIEWAKALQHVREAVEADVPASITYQPSPLTRGRFVLVIDEICIEITHVPLLAELESEVKWTLPNENRVIRETATEFEYLRKLPSFKRNGSGW